MSFTSGFLVPRGSQPDLSVTPSPAPVASVPASPAAPERPHTAPSSPVASPRAAEGPVTPAPLMPAAPAATHEGGLRDRAESDLGLDWLFGKNNDDWMDSNSGPLATHTTPAALPSNPATPPAQPKNNGTANGISTLGGLVTAGSLGYLIAELVKSKEVQAVVGRAFKKLAGKKVAPLTGRQRRIAQRLGLDAGVAGAGMLAGLIVLICGRSMRRRV